MIIILVVGVETERAVIIHLRMVSLHPDIFLMKRILVSQEVEAVDTGKTE